MSYTTSIPSFSTTDDEHVKYSVLVTSKASGDHWEVSLRYSELQSLYTDLNTKVPGFKYEGTFPPKHFFGSLSVEDLEARRAGLDSYLSAAASHEEVGRSLTLDKYIGPESEGVVFRAGSATTRALVLERLTRVAASLGIEDLKLKALFPHLYKTDTHFQITPTPPDVSLAAFVDHTILKPESSGKDIAKIVEEAVTNRFAAVCVATSQLPTAVSEMTSQTGGDTWRVSSKKSLSALSDFNKPVPGVAVVVGFPHGDTTTATKAAETAEAVAVGATEIDMVVHVGKLLESNYDYVKNDIAAVVEAAGPASVKVILEAGLLTREALIDGCICSVLAGAAFVKTSTGFTHNGKKAAVSTDVALMKQVVGASALVKASGGVKTPVAARTMIAIGASRLGTSSGIALVSGGTASSGY